MKHLLLFFLLILGIFSSKFSYSQETNGGLTGKVLDAGGQPLAGATVEAIHVLSGTHYATATGIDGRFNLPGMRIGGPYKISAHFTGMTTQIKDNISVNLGALSSLNFILADNTKQLSELVVKTAKSGSKSNIYGTGTNVSSTQLRNLPSGARSLQDFTRLTPQGTKDNSFLGSNYRYNNVTIDGAINNDAIGFSPSLGGQSGTSGQPGSSTRTTPISLDAIQDIQIYLAPYDVKIGNFTGGSVNAVTRSGTNSVTGSVYGFLRNAALVGSHDAVNNVNSKEPSAFHDYTFGVRLGFPLIKNKLFFFTNEEETRRQDPVLLNASNDPSVINSQIAQVLTDTLKKYNINPGSYGAYNIYSKSNKFFNRLDWNIGERNQLSIRNNYITSEATNLERDQANFRFGSIDYVQHNNQNSTVAELKTRFNNNLSNSFLLGYSTVHDFRNPTSDPSLPQMEIKGIKGGTTIFIGTDREGAIFDLHQKTFEFTDNLSWYKGKHTFTIGTHNELYKITYDFVNSWNGRLSYNSIAGATSGLGGVFNPSSGTLYANPNTSFLSLLARARGAYSYTDDTRAGILANPSAQFNVNLYSVYAQDEYAVSDHFKIIPGIRFDMADVPNKQPLSSKTLTTPIDPSFGNTYGYTQPKNITQKYLGQIQVSPRIGFTYDIRGDKSLVIRGGSGLFTGRIPFAWMGYAFYNNGNTYGFFDQKYTGTTRPKNGGNPIAQLPSPIGFGNYITSQGVNISDKTSKTQIDLIDNNFKMPKVWRSSLALDWSTETGYKFSLEGVYTKTIHDLVFKNVNQRDSAYYYAYDSQHKQPIFYGSGATNAAPGYNANVNKNLTANYLLSNTSLGYRYNVTASISRVFEQGFNFNASYTYGESKDVTNGIRNSMESNWQLNQALNPNNPGLAYSNFDIRHRVVVTLGYVGHWNARNVTNVNLVLTAQSGSPFTYGFSNATIDNTGQQISLAYIPKVGETQNLFADIPASGTTALNPASSQAAAFDAYINSNKYLSSRRGGFTERNAGRTPWNTNADFRLSHDFIFGAGERKSILTFSYDILNLTNLVDQNLGKVYFVNNTFNSTADIGLIYKANQPNGNPQYTWSQPNTPWQIDPFLSRWSMQFGIRFTF